MRTVVYRKPSSRTRAVEGPTLADEAGIDAAYAAYGAELYRFALRGLGDKGAAEDVVQETFLRAWRAADRFDENIASLRVWLFAIAKNTMISHVRASQARPLTAAVAENPESESERASPAGEDFTDRLLRCWVVEEALQRISEEHRTAIVETHLKDRPYSEVAAEYGVPVGTLRSRVFYGLKALRAAIDEMGVAL